MVAQSHGYLVEGHFGGCLNDLGPATKRPIGEEEHTETCEDHHKTLP